MPRPGEISLAHHGVLFLDELAEWDRRVLEVLREPLESGVVHISRAARQSTFPAQFQLVAAMNPCPCGWLNHASGRCGCTPEQVARYRKRVSGALYDRIDMAIEVPALAASDLTSPGTHAPAGAPASSEGTGQVRERVARAHARQSVRQGKPNARLSAAEIERQCPRSAPAERILAQAMSRLFLSARGYHRVVKLARTIADLAGSEVIEAQHAAEAVGYRRDVA